MGIESQQNISNSTGGVVVFGAHDAFRGSIERIYLYNIKSTGKKDWYIFQLHTTTAAITTITTTTNEILDDCVESNNKNPIIC